MHTLYTWNLLRQAHANRSVQEHVIIHGKDLSLSDYIMHSCSQLTQLHREILPVEVRHNSPIPQQVQTYPDH